MDRIHRIKELSVHEQGTDSVSDCMMVPNTVDKTALAVASTVPCNSQDSLSALHSLMSKMYWYEVSKAIVTFWKALTDMPLLLPQLTSLVMLLQHWSAPAPTQSL